MNRETIQKLAEESANEHHYNSDFKEWEAHAHGFIYGYKKAKKIDDTDIQLGNTSEREEDDFEKERITFRFIIDLINRIKAEKCTDENEQGIQKAQIRTLEKACLAILAFRIEKFTNNQQT